MKTKEKMVFDGGGLVIFQEVTHGINAEKLLRGHDYEAKLVAPPLEHRAGCDLALEINLVEQGGIERILQENDAPYVKFVQIKGSTELVNIVKPTDYGEWMAVKTGNMKISYEKKSGKIVNISGGGCPDIPYLHVQMVGKRLDEAPRPRDLGYTLCALMLDRAYVESVRIWKGGLAA